MSADCDPDGYRTDFLIALGHTLPSYFPLTLQIALVAHDYHREVVLILDPQNLLLERRDFLEALTGCDGVNEQEAFSCPHILFSHGGIFFLSGSIENIQQRNLVIDNALLAV